MKRKFKNILMIVLIVLLGAGMYFTIDQAKNSSSSVSTTSENSTQGPPDMQNGQGGTPPDMNNSSDNSSDSTNQQSNDNQGGTPPEKPSGDNGSSGGTPPAKPGENSSSNDSSNDNTTSENSNNSSNSMPSGSQDSSMTPPDMQSTSESSSNDIPVFFYVLFGIEALIEALLIVYLLMSVFNKKSLKETMTPNDKKLIYVLSVIILTGCLTFVQVFLAQNTEKSTNNQKENTQTTNNQNSDVSQTGKVEIDGEKKTLTDSYDSETADESVILVKNSGTLTLKNATVNKKSGDSSNTENSEFYGVNSGVLVTSGTANITDTTIKTNAKGSNAVFATGENSKIYISDSTITTTGSSSSRGLDATYGGYIKADNVKITTKGGSCATLATDRGEGTVIANNSTLETNGSGSPVIYSTGDIQIDSTKGTANGSQMVVIEGKNSATITSSKLNASGAGNRNDVDQAGVMIYQSMSGDASEGKGTFTATDSTLTIQKDSDYYKTAPMFFITNTSAEINLENTKLSYGSNILLSAKGTSEWGNSGSNGGEVTLNATNQTLTGNIEVDKISTLTLNLTTSTYKGKINTDNTAKSITLKLDKKSKITLTGDSYVSSLEDADSSYSNIDFNGYKLYVNGKAIN